MSVMAGDSEAELMKACSPLYGTIAIEALSSVIMAALFMYLWVKISTKADIKAPFRAIWRLVKYTFKNAVGDFIKHMMTWPSMSTATLSERFLFCRKCNQAVLLFQAFIALISVTRWLHIGNVNGFRYLGYAFTCPPMQAMLVLLIAPVVPCYRWTISFTYLITFCMLISGWVASTRTEHLFNCDLSSLLEFDDECFDFTKKFWAVTPAICTLSFLSFVQIPYLAILYCCNGGGRNPELPRGYVKALAIVSFTWLGFPAWWFLSFEGMGVIGDTKLNAVGFAVLNVISKGALAYQVLDMVKLHKEDMLAAGDRDLLKQLGAMRGRSGSNSSLDSSVGSCDDNPSEVRAALSITAWLVRFLQNFDDGKGPGTLMPPPESSESSLSRMQSPAGDSTAMSTVQENHPADSESQSWDELEHMYRRFLRDAGVTAYSFQHMSAVEKVNVREKFDKVSSAVLVGGQRGAPKWASSSMGLKEASDQQLLDEMRDRLQKKISASPPALEEAAGDKDARSKGLDRDDMPQGLGFQAHCSTAPPEDEVSNSENDYTGFTPRRAYHV
jgi:hypothetical protein